jgi:hypothetical protein
MLHTFSFLIPKTKQFETSSSVGHDNFCFGNSFLGGLQFLFSYSIILVCGLYKHRLLVFLALNWWKFLISNVIYL